MIEEETRLVVEEKEGRGIDHLQRPPMCRKCDVSLVDTSSAYTAVKHLRWDRAMSVKVLLEDTIFFWLVAGIACHTIYERD